MSKHNKTSVEYLRAQLKKQEEALSIKCNHQKKNGDLNVKWINRDKGLVECRSCGEKYSMEVFVDDQGNISEVALRAVKIVNSMIQQLRASTNSDEEDLVENFGKIAYVVKQVPAKYEDLISALGKNSKKKKKKKQGNSIGGYGDGLSVVRGRRK